ncbi:hypothetical protein D3C84_1068080 [compost metagenome]
MAPVAHVGAHPRRTVSLPMVGVGLPAELARHSKIRVRPLHAGGHICLRDGSDVPALT